MNHHKNVCIAQAAGSSTAIAGFVLVAVGFGLSFATFRASLLLSGVGGGICAAGGLTAAGSSIKELRIQKGTFDKAQEIIDEDREATEAIQKRYEQFQVEVQLTKVGNGVKFVGNTANMMKSCVHTGVKLGRVGSGELPARAVKSSFAVSVQLAESLTLVALQSVLSFYRLTFTPW